MKALCVFLALDASTVSFLMSGLIKSILLWVLGKNSPGNPLPSDPKPNLVPNLTLNLTLLLTPHVGLFSGGIFSWHDFDIWMHRCQLFCHNQGIYLNEYMQVAEH